MQSPKGKATEHVNISHPLINFECRLINAATVQVHILFGVAREQFVHLVGELMSAYATRLDAKHPLYEAIHDDMSLSPVNERRVRWCVHVGSDKIGIWEGCPDLAAMYQVDFLISTLASWIVEVPLRWHHWHRRHPRIRTSLPAFWGAPCRQRTREACIVHKVRRPNARGIRRVRRHLALLREAAPRQPVRRPSTTNL